MSDAVHPLGLTAAEAAARLAQDGPNTLPVAGRTGFFALILEVAREPMFLLLIAGAVVSLVIGDLAEAVMLGIAVLGVVTITIVQEHRTSRALASLRDLAAPRAIVVRDGKPVRVAAAEVVVGDHVVLVEGDRVPADARVVEAFGLRADESLLTGESVPVAKVPLVDEAPPPADPGGPDSPWLWSGSLVTGGRGAAVVTATGPRTAMGRIGTALAEIGDLPGPLRVEFARVTKWLGLLALALALTLVAVVGFLRGDWLQAILSGIAFGMSMLPEELPVVLTVFFAIGASRIATKRVLTRHFPAIETLGAATVLCVDKTGTLTVNRMTVRRLWRDGRFVDVSPEATLEPEDDALLRVAAAASPPTPVDPMDAATRTIGVARDLHAPTEGLELEVPLTHERPMLTLVWRTTTAGAFEVATKGAPEHVAEITNVDATQRAAITSALETMAADGLRVLAIAAGTTQEATEAGALTALRFVGLLAYEDPVRPEVPAAMKAAHEAGIRVVVITGDAPATAGAVARQVGLDGEITLGPEAAALDDAALDAVVARTSVFARAVPDLKLRLVRALQARGEVVAMTGDGVNDAPALQAAHIGIAMGKRGTDVAREAADLVLLDDDFAAVVDAVALGRRIHENLEKAIRFILAVHVPIAGASLLPPLLGWPILLTPVHIAMMELVIDPACSIAFEAEPAEPGIMRRPPRRADAPMFHRALVVGAVLQGLVLLAAVLGVYVVALDWEASSDAARAAGFLALLVGLIGLIADNRSHDESLFTSLRRRNIAFLAVAGGTVAAATAMLAVPWLRDLFRFDLPSPSSLGLAVAAGVLSIVPTEIAKQVRRLRAPRP